VIVAYSDVRPWEWLLGVGKDGGQVETRIDFCETEVEEVWKLDEQDSMTW
jgi:hypothetical protein